MTMKSQRLRDAKGESQSRSLTFPVTIKSQRTRKAKGELDLGVDIEKRSTRFQVAILKPTTSIVTKRRRKKKLSSRDLRRSGSKIKESKMNYLGNKKVYVMEQKCWMDGKQHLLKVEW